MMTNAMIANIILVFILISLIANKIPTGLTALLGALAMALFGIISFSDVLSQFGSDTVMMVVGVFVIGNTMFETGCAQLIGKVLVRIKGVGTNEKNFLTFIMIFTAGLSAFVSNTATLAMMLPLIASVAATSGGTITKKNTYMATAIASIVGGNISLAGSTPQLVAQGILEQTAGCRTLTFFELARGTLPVLIVMLIYFVTIGYRFQKRVFDFPDVPDCGAATRQSDAISYKKAILSATIFIGCVIAFATSIAKFGTIAIIGACLCCLTGCITPSRIWATMDWNTIIVLGGSLGFAAGMEQSGALRLIADNALAILGAGSASIWLSAAAIIIVCSAFSNLMSNTATTAMMAPIAIAMAQGMHQDPIPYVVMVIIASNLAFATPVSTPPMTMVLIGGYRFSDYLKVGGLFNIIAVVVAIFTLPVLYGLV